MKIYYGLTGLSVCFWLLELYIRIVCYLTEKSSKIYILLPNIVLSAWMLSVCVYI